MSGLEVLLLDHPTKEANALLHTIDEVVTRGDAVASAHRYAEQLGDVKSRAVALQMTSGPEMLCAMFGVWMAGGVAVPMNTRASLSEQQNLLAAVEPRFVVTNDDIEALKTKRVYDEDSALLIWTSGTTGVPKPVLHSHTSYLELIDRVIGSLAGARRSDRPTPNLIPVSLALNAGLYNSLFGLRASAEIILMDRFEPMAFATLVRRHQVTSTVLPPAAISMLLDSPIDSLAPLRFVRSITAALSPLKARMFMERFNVFVLNGYGQAELGEVIGWRVSDAKDHPEKLGSIGKPHPGVEIRLGDDGLLWVKPPTTAHGLEDRTDHMGFINTGDLARIDEDGFVWLDGRLGDLINRGGNKVHPEAVEDVLMLVPGVMDACVIGMPDERLGEVPVAVLTGSIVDDEVIIATCREFLSPYKVPVKFIWVNEIPRNEVGKKLRKAVSSYVVGLH